jgi:uncharacterized iron-regulated protein
MPQTMTDASTGPSSVGPGRRRRRSVATALGLLLVLGGCAAGPRHVEPQIPADVRTALAVYEGQSGQRSTWSALMDAVEEADVVIIGEEHDDVVGHRVELAIVEDVLERWPGSAVSMEMFDRSEQSVVDDYLADFIDRNTFYERTASTRWLKICREYLDGSINRKTFKRRITTIGWPDWEGNYQPIIEAAKEAGSPIVAANTPWRVYTSVARKEGYERLDDVTPAQRALFEVPDELIGGRYRERFWEALVDRAEGEAPPVQEDESGAHPGLTDEQVLEMYRAHLVMDATMADSIAGALRAGAVKVVHLVGHFHCDFQGGLVQELRRRQPEVGIVVVSMQSTDEPELREEDVDRGDFVIYTAYREPE